MKKVILITIFLLVCVAGISCYQLVHFYDGKLHVVFCDVGQGDAILITTPSRKHILIDGGPDKKVLDCISRHLPFWERNIDLMILSHPHADHLVGMHFVLQRYSITQFGIEALDNETRIYKDLLAAIETKEIPTRIIWAGDSWMLEDDVVLTVAAPTQEFIDRTSPQGKIGESGEFASLISQLTYGDFSALFTGDSQLSGLEEAKALLGNSVAILQVPHHGSASGLSQEFLERLSPQLAVISVGEDNSYNHPTPLTLNLLKQAGISVSRTDKEGDIHIVSDGESWQRYK